MPALIRVIFVWFCILAIFPHRIILSDEKSSDERMRVLEEEAVALATQAEKPGLSDDKRNALLRSAAQAYEKLAATQAQAAEDRIRTRSYGSRLDAMLTLGYRMLHPYAWRILLLEASPQDAQFILRQSEDVLQTMVRFEKELTDLIIEHRRESLRMVLDHYLPALLNYQMRVQYFLAWTKLFRAVAANFLGPAEAKRVNAPALLLEAGKAAQPFSVRPDCGVQTLALLLRGIAFREMGKFDQARQELEKAVRNETDTLSRVHAGFQLARNAIEAGWTDRTAAAIEAFRIQAEKTVPQQKAEIAAAVKRLRQHQAARSRTTQPAK